MPSSAMRHFHGSTGPCGGAESRPDRGDHLMVRRTATGLLATIVVAALATTLGPVTTVAAHHAPGTRVDDPRVLPAIARHPMLASLLPSPLTTSECLSGFGIH